jgi:glycosyltransferase involved in cell wall biosynthesis
VKQLAFVIPWREKGKWLWQYLPDRTYSGTIITAGPGAGSFWEKHEVLPPYLRETWHLSRRGSFSDFDAVFAWELRCIVAVAVLRKLRPANRRMSFIAVGPILKGPVLRVLPLVRWLLTEADRIVCFSEAECKIQARVLKMPSDRFVFVPTAWKIEEISLQKEQTYVLSLGHSGRDYPTLLKSVGNEEMPVILAIKDRSDLCGCAIPRNVTVRYRTSEAETDRLIDGASLIVLPLRGSDQSAGQSVLLRSMARGKAVIVTKTSGIRDYVWDRETAIFVPPGDAEAMRKAILELWNSPEQRSSMGKNAANRQRQEFGFPRLTERLVTVAEEI